MKKTQRTSSRNTSQSGAATPKGAKAKSKATKAKRRINPLLVAGAVVLLAVVIGLVVYFVRGASHTDAVVTVNGNPITEEQLDFQYNLLPQSYRESFTRDQVLEQIIDEELIVQIARRQGLNATPEDVNERVQDIMAQNDLTASDLQTNLADLNVTLDQFEQLIARQIIIERYLKATLKPSEVDNETLMRTYSESLDKYAVGEQVTVRHVLISNQRPDAALAAKRIYDAARNGTDFCDLVKNASDDRGSRNTCGQYTFPRNFMVPEFEAASFGMKNGEIRLVQSQFGYHIILKINNTPAGYKPFSEVYDDLRGEYESSERSQQYRSIVLGLRERATISYPNGTTLLPQQPSTVSAPEMPPAPEVPPLPVENVTVPSEPENVTANATQNATIPAAPENVTAPPNVTENATQNVTTNVTPRAENKTVPPVQPPAEAPQVPPEQPPAQPETPPVNATPDTSGLLSCIASKTTLYGTSWSSDAQDARTLFARNNVPLKYVSCDEKRAACRDIIAYPTWDIAGERYLGRLTIAQLRNAANC